MSPPVPTSEVTEAIRRWSARELAQVVLDQSPGSRWRTIVATWIWCMAKTIALAPQRRPSSKQAAASARERDAVAAELRGYGADSAPASRSAAIVSGGKRASRSTSSAWVAATSSAIRRMPSRNARSRSTAMLMRPRFCSSLERRVDCCDGLEDAALEHRSGNSTSKASSSASITLTLACEVMPAWYRSASSARESTSTGSRAWSRSTRRISGASALMAALRCSRAPRRPRCGRRA